ncbi:uncharacterized protein LOC132727946 [Ruditapes philippinarum]|uniref:uncharacterized protein LOC132727946 n=1 Tax=Ruditapes philippinarum TaxID=129788 RepID=UPI00295C0AB6|nr:uncharacterized protein LOC132727946 [Ruditapes philippinarum]XP_060569534.1 uncharacterized protein LOC132727946 [Ruditapes philippinarum]
MALPNGPMEIVFSFDTTGSMSSCLAEVRGRVADMAQRLQADIPGIKMAIFAHGDYCDKHNYVTKFVDFTDDVTKLVDFAQNVSSTGGGDADECYELVLHEVRTKLSWTPGSQRALVMIGDCNPHEPNYPQNKLRLNWRVEADELAKIRVRIYSVQCHSHNADKFYSEIARRTDGQHLKLSDFKNIFDFLMTVCYKERGDDLFLTYEKEVRARSSGINKDLQNLFGGLKDNAPTDISPKTVKLGKIPKKGLKIAKEKKKTKPAVKSVKKSLSIIKKKKPLPAHKKYLEKYLPKLRRENVSENNFLLREMNWSKWQLVIHPLKKVVKDTATQVASDVSCPRKGCGHGYRAKTIFGGKTKVPAIYEIGVQTNKHARKYVTYNKMCRGFTYNLNWENKLFGRKDIRSQIDRLVGKNCSVYVRRMLLKGDKSKVKVRQALRRYDYAWKGLKSVRDGNRSVFKGNVEISCKMDM